MIKFITFICLLASTCSARPDVNIIPQNVVTVPTNCPEGQQWVNGQCRDIWKITAAPANVITVPPNCPPGQEFVNGQCRDVWIKTLSEQNNLGLQSYSGNADVGPQNMVTVPPNCRPGQQWINGSCRDVWRSALDTNKNVIQVPDNCPEGQSFVNGQCREIWRSSSDLIENYINKLKNFLARTERQVENFGELPDQDEANRNVISVPNQCPTGYKPDALGICREILF